MFLFIIIINIIESNVFYRGGTYGTETGTLLYQSEIIKGKQTEKNLPGRILETALFSYDWPWRRWHSARHKNK